MDLLLLKISVLLICFENNRLYLSYYSKWTDLIAVFFSTKHVNGFSFIRSDISIYLLTSEISVYKEVLIYHSPTRCLSFSSALFYLQINE